MTLLPVSLKAEHKLSWRGALSTSGSRTLLSPEMGDLSQEACIGELCYLICYSKPQLHLGSSLTEHPNPSFLLLSILTNVLFLV